MNSCVPSGLLFLLFYRHQGAWVKEIHGAIVKLSLYGSSTSINIPASWMHGENESGLPLMPWLSTCAIVEVVLSVDTQALIFWASLQRVLLPMALCSAPCSQDTRRATSSRRKKRTDLSRLWQRIPRVLTSSFPFPLGDMALLHFPAPLAVRWDRVTEFCPVECGRGNYSGTGI